MPNTKKLKFIVTDNAYAMLSTHFHFLAQVSKIAANRLIASFKSSSKRIAASPLQFPLADDGDAPGIPPNTYRKCLFEHRYKIIFFMNDEVISIDAVLDTRMENKGIFQ